MILTPLPPAPLPQAQLPIRAPCTALHAPSSSQFWESSLPGRLGTVAGHSQAPLTWASLTMPVEPATTHQAHWAPACTRPRW